MFEKRSGNQTGLSSIGTSSRSAHHGCVFGLQFDGDTEQNLGSPRVGVDGASGIGIDGGDSNDRRVAADDGRSVADYAALYAARKGATNTIGKTEMGAAAATTAAHPPAEILR